MDYELITCDVCKTKKKMPNVPWYEGRTKKEINICSVCGKYICFKCYDNAEKCYEDAGQDCFDGCRFCDENSPDYISHYIPLHSNVDAVLRHPYSNETPIYPPLIEHKNWNPTFDRCMKALDSIFAVQFHLESTIIKIFGHDSYCNYMTGNAIYPQDFPPVLHLIKFFCKNPELAHHKKVQSQMSLRLKDVNKLMDTYCSSTIETKLGKANHCFKAKKADIKLKNKYLRALQLKLC